MYKLESATFHCLSIRLNLDLMLASGKSPLPRVRRKRRGPPSPSRSVSTRRDIAHSLLHTVRKKIMPLLPNPSLTRSVNQLLQHPSIVSSSGSTGQGNNYSVSDENERALRKLDSIGKDTGLQARQTQTSVTCLLTPSCPDFRPVSRPSQYNLSCP